MCIFVKVEKAEGEGTGLDDVLRLRRRQRLGCNTIDSTIHRDDLLNLWNRLKLGCSKTCRESNMERQKNRLRLAHA